MYSRLVENAHRCSYENCFETNNLVVVPVKKRLEILKQFKLFISKNARMCSNHAEFGEWHQLTANALTNFTKKQLEEMTTLLGRNTKIEPPGLKVITNERETGLSMAIFLVLFNSFPSLRREFRNVEKAKLALKTFLTRLRSGDPLCRNCILPSLSLVTQRKYIRIVRAALLKDFVPLHLGFDSFSRNELVQNSSQMAKH